MKHILGKCGYIHNRENGNLEYVEMISAKFQINKDEVEYKALVGGVEKVFTESRLDCMFDSKADFEKGNERDDYTIFLYQFENLDFVANAGNPYGYKFLNGDAVMEYAIDVEFIYDYDKGKVRVANGTKYYESREKVFEYNDYTEVDKKGNKHQVTCLANRMKMSEKQTEAIKNLQKAIENCVENNIALFFNMSDFELQAFNKSAFKEMECCYHKDKPLEAQNVTDHYVKVSHNISYYNEEEVIYGTE
jgi:hypothetical protein